MTKWRPHHSIRVKALGLAWRDGRLLASEIYRDDGTVKGVRPLGGSVEFGETWYDALVREFQEELSVTVQPIGAPLVLENIYTHHGATGHEVIFAADVHFPQDAYRQDGPIEYLEDNGETCRAFWYDIETLDHGDVALYPTGLKSRLQERSRRS